MLELEKISKQIQDVEGDFLNCVNESGNEGASLSLSFDGEQLARLKFFFILVSVFDGSPKEFYLRAKAIELIFSNLFLRYKVVSLDSLTIRVIKDLLQMKDYKSATFVSSSIERIATSVHERFQAEGLPESTNQERLITLTEKSYGDFWGLSLQLSAVDKPSVIQFDCYEIGKNLGVIFKLIDDLNKFGADGGENYNKKRVDHVNVTFDEPDFSAFSEEDLIKAKKLALVAIDERFYKIKDILYSWRYQKFNKLLIDLFKQEITNLIKDIK